MGFSTHTISMSFPRWVNYYEAPPIPNTLEDGFKEIILFFSEEKIGLSECIEKCTWIIEHTLQAVDSDLSERSQQMIELHIKNFNKTVDETSYLISDESSNLKAAFKKSLCKVVEEKWANNMAQIFHFITAMLCEKEKIAAAKKWTHQYLLGLDYFLKLKDFSMADEEELLKQLIQKTLSAFRAYSHEMINKKMVAISVRAQEYPNSFDKIMNFLGNKLEKDPNSLLSFEMEYVEFAQYQLSGGTIQWPAISENEKWLQKCIWDEYIYQKSKRYTLGNIADTIYDRLIKKYDGDNKNGSVSFEISGNNMEENDGTRNFFC